MATAPTGSRPETVVDLSPTHRLRGRIIPAFGDKRLKQITTSEVRQWLTSLLQEVLSPATVRTYRQILGQVLNQAVADDLIQANPVEKVKAPTVRPRRQLFLTASELEMLAEASGDYGPLVWFLGWSGLRFGEAAALRVGMGTSTLAGGVSAWKSQSPKWAAHWRGKSRVFD